MHSYICDVLRVESYSKLIAKQINSCPEIVI